jgi:hypothetical protein
MGIRGYSQASIRILLAFLCGVALLFGGISQEEIPLRLAGQAKFPTPHAFSWQQTQASDNINAEDKIKSTIDTYFIIINDSLKTLELLDFGFLFDLKDINAWNDYAYERGSMHVRIEVNRESDLALTSYVYKPDYFSFIYKDASADVKMTGHADWTMKLYGARIVPSPWTEHEFKLALMDGQWKIKSVRCPDQDHNLYPRNTDFDKAAEGAVRELRRLKKHDTSALKQKQVSPDRDLA